MNDLVFSVTQEGDGGLVAQALGESIVVQADTWDELRTQVREAVAAFYFDQPKPQNLRLRMVHDEVLTPDGLHLPIASLTENPVSISQLERWFVENCNGDWEHGRGVTIETLDNPGWMVRISLADTTLADVSFAPIKTDLEHPVDWLRCEVKDREFLGACGPEKLNAVLNIFLKWAADAPKENADSRSDLPSA